MTHVKTRKNSEAKRAYRKEGSKSRSRRRRRRRRKRRRAENKKKVTTGVNLRSRFALNFDFTIVVLAISPLAKSSLKDFVAFFIFFLFFSRFTIHIATTSLHRCHLSSLLLRIRFLPFVTRISLFPRTQIPFR